MLLTGATGGIGPHVAARLAGRRHDLALTALPDDAELEAVATRVRELGSRAVTIPVDLRQAEAPLVLATRAVAELGRVDALVHCAGVERVGAFEKQTAAELEEVLRVNLGSAMELSRLLLPGMLRRGSGRLVFVASLAGKVGPGWTGAYAASKAGLVGFARSLRAEYRGRGVAASVVVPGFVAEVGMFGRARARGIPPGRVLGTVRAYDVARGVLRALERGAPEVVVQRGPVRLALALGELLPGLVGARLSRWSGADRLLRSWAADAAGSSPAAGDAEL